MNREQASEAFRRAGVQPDSNFFTLSASQVDALIVEADRLKYRKPKNANGSRGRYFHGACQRALQRRDD